MDIGKRLRELRAAKGFSQGDIEHRTGLLRCYLSRVENGHTVPSFETLERLARALEIETYQLFFEGDKEPEAIPAKRGDLENARESKFIATFRNLNQKDQDLVLGLMGKLAKLS
jgi:transcriptional regulator with XRE-family HTH domain